MGGPPLDNNALTDIIRELVVQQRQLKDTVEVIRQSTLSLLPPESYAKPASTSNASSVSSPSVPPTKPFASIDEIVSDIRELKQSVSTLTRDLSLLRQEQQHHNVEVQKQVLFLDSEVSRMQSELGIVSTNVSTCDASMKTLSDHVYSDMQKVSAMVRAVRTGNEQQMATCMDAVERQSKKTMELEEALLTAVTGLSERQHAAATALAHTALNAFETMTRGVTAGKGASAGTGADAGTNVDKEGAFRLGIGFEGTVEMISDVDAYGHISSTSVVEDRFLPSDDDTDDAHDNNRDKLRRQARSQRRHVRKSGVSARGAAGALSPSRPSPPHSPSRAHSRSPSPLARTHTATSQRATTTTQRTLSDTTTTPRPDDSQRPWSPSQPPDAPASARASVAASASTTPRPTPSPRLAASAHTSPLSTRFTHALGRSPRHAQDGASAGTGVMEGATITNAPSLSARAHATQDALQAMGGKTRKHKARKYGNSENREFVDSTQLGESRLMQTLNSVLATSVPKMEHPLDKIPPLRIPGNSGDSGNSFSQSIHVPEKNEKNLYRPYNSRAGGPRSTGAGTDFATTASSTSTLTRTVDLQSVQSSLRSLTEALFASLHHDLRALHHTVTRLDARQLRDSHSIVTSTQEALQLLRARVDAVERTAAEREEEEKRELRVWSTRVMGLERDLATDVQRIEANVAKMGRENRVFEENFRKTVSELRERVCAAERQVAVSCGTAMTFTQSLHLGSKTGGGNAGSGSGNGGTLTGNLSASTPSSPSSSSASSASASANPADTQASSLSSLTPPTVLAHTPLESQVSALSHALHTCRARVDTFSAEMVRRLHALETTTAGQAREGERRLEEAVTMLQGLVRGCVRESKEEMGRLMAGHVCPCMWRAGVPHSYGDVVTKPGRTGGGRPGSARGRLMVGKLGAKHLVDVRNPSGFSGYHMTPDAGMETSGQRGDASRPNSQSGHFGFMSEREGKNENSEKRPISRGSLLSQAASLSTSMSTVSGDMPATGGRSDGTEITDTGNGSSGGGGSDDTASGKDAAFSSSDRDIGASTSNNADHSIRGGVSSQTIDGTTIAFPCTTTARTRIRTVTYTLPTTSLSAKLPRTATATRTTARSLPSERLNFKMATGESNGFEAAGKGRVAQAVIGGHSTQTLSRVLGANVVGAVLAEKRERERLQQETLESEIMNQKPEQSGTLGSGNLMGIAGYVAPNATPQHLGLSRARTVTHSHK